MPHLPPGVGVPDGVLSLDHLIVTWMLIQLALVLLLVLALRIVPFRNGHRPPMAPRPASPTPARSARRGRPRRRHLQAVA